MLGAGVWGLYQIRRLADLSIDALLLEADDDPGGTRYRNRYPGIEMN